MRVYLAGPMTGVPQMNFPAFDAAAADLRARGYDVVSPAELDSPESRAAALAAAEGDISCYSRETGETWGDLLARDVKLIADGGIQGIVVLPGWEGSRGARLETFVARLCHVPIYAYDGDFLSRIRALDIDDAHGVPDFHSFDDVEDVWDILARIGGPGPTGSSQPRDAEVRITDPKTGGQKGQKLCQLGALDPLALMEVGKVAGFGAGKYARFNFVRGYAWSLSYDALLRHLLQWASGEECDDESGFSHLAHASWHTLALLTFVLRDRGTDDRLPRMLEEAA